MKNLTKIFGSFKELNGKISRYFTQNFERVYHEETRRVYGPYIEAIKKILDGEPVKDLDNLRRQGNKEFEKIELFEDKKRRLNLPKTKNFGELPRDRQTTLLISFAANAENKILMGEDPIQQYQISDIGNPLEFREKCRKILEYCIQDNFSLF